MFDGDETFSLNLSNPSAGTAIVDGAGQGTILDDDAPTLSIGDVIVPEGDSSAAFAAYVKDEIAKWKGVIEDAKIPKI